MTINLYSRGQHVGGLTDLVIYGRQPDYHQITATVRRFAAPFPDIHSDSLAIGPTVQAADAFVPDLFFQEADEIRFRGTVYHTAPERCPDCEGGWRFEAGAFNEGWVECERCLGTAVARNGVAR